MTETTDPALTIRPAETADADAIAALFTDEGYPAGPSDIVERMTRFASEHSRVVIAEHEQTVLGFIAVHALPRFEHDDPLSGEHRRDGRFDDTGRLCGGRLRYSLLLDEEPQHLRIAHWLDGVRFVFIRLDQITQDIEIILFRRRQPGAVEKRIDHCNRRVAIGVRLQGPQRESTDKLEVPVLGLAVNRSDRR